MICSFPLFFMGGSENSPRFPEASECGIEADVSNIFASPLVPIVHFEVFKVGLDAVTTPVKRSIDPDVSINQTELTHSKIHSSWRREIDETSGVEVHPRTLLWSIQLCFGGLTVTVNPCS